MVTFICPQCGKESTGQRKRCYECTGFKGTPESAEKNRQASLGNKPSMESRRKNSERHKGNVHRYNLAEAQRGKQPHNWRPIGSERVENGHIKVKCEGGQWRYRARVMWVETHGPIPQGMLIHHINENPFDDRMENFQLVTRVEHGRIHADPLIMKARGAKAHA